MGNVTQLGAPAPLSEDRMALLNRALTTAATPGGRLILAGESGIGKTFIVDRLVAELPPSTPLLFARGAANDQRPYGALAGLLSSVPEADFRRLPTVQRNSVFSVLGRSRSPRIDAAPLQAGVTKLLEDAARAGATIVVDDWQWLDTQSVNALERALQRPSLRQGLSIVGTRQVSMTSDDTSSSPVFGPADIARVPVVPGAAMRAVLDEAGIRGLSASDLAEIIRTSGGNPLWAIELATSRLAGDRDPYASRSLRDAMSGRLASLSTALRETLLVVSLMGGARLADLVTICPQAEETVSEGRRQRILRIEGEFVRPAYPLLATAAVRALSAEQARATHALIAALPIATARQLEHLDSATPPGIDEGLANQLTEAALLARRDGATRNALRLSQRAIARTAETAPKFSSRLINAAELSYALGDTGIALDLLGRLDVAVLRLAELDRSLGILANALDREAGHALVASRLWNVQRAFAPHSPAWNVIQVFLLTYGDVSQTDPLQELVSLAATLSVTETPRSLAAALYWIALFRLDRGHGLSKDVVARLRDLDATAFPPALEETSEALEALLSYQADDLAWSRAKLSTFVRSARISGEDYATVQAMAHASLVETLAGRLDAAAAFLNEADAAAATLTVLPPSVFRAHGMYSLARNDRAAIEEIIGGPLNPSAEGRGDLLRIGLAGLDSAYEGHWELALVDLERAHAIARQRGIDEPGRRLWVDVELIRAHIHVEQFGVAEALIDDLRIVGNRQGRAHARGQALRLQALLTWKRGDARAAVELASNGLGDLRRGGFQPEALRAQLEQVSMLQETGQTSRARRDLALAEKTARKVGDPRILLSIEQLATHLAASDGRSSLTAAELRVAKAASIGRSNREIATDFFLSVRTVETHLASVYRKLGLRTRTQLALNLNDMSLPTAI